MATHTYDVVVVGASIAGCTAAALYGRAGLKVALIERQQDINAHKKLCTHYIQPSAKPTLDRLGLSAQIEAAGGIRNGMAFWTKWGWIQPYDDPRFPPHGYSLRRKKLDPMLRQLAAGTPGVDLFLGQAERISPLLGMLKGEFHLRSAAVSGLAFVGDAAASTDPLWGCGCGWAFESAAWLVEATTVALSENGNVDRALRRYKKRHRWRLAAHNWYNGRFASGRNFYLHERVALAAATRDEQCARHIHAFAARNTGVAQLHSPRNFARAAWVNLTQAVRDRVQGR